MRDEAYQVFQGELGSGEKLLWSGRPKTGLTFRSSDIYMNAKSNGSGTIVFGPTPPMNRMFAGNLVLGSGRHQSPIFEMIEEAKIVYDRIRQAQNQDSQ